MARVPQTHYLRSNESEWTPRYVAFWDTETYPVTEGTRQNLQMRLWTAALVDRKEVASQGVKVRTEWGADRRSLARWFNGVTVGHPTVWSYAHNLGFDLTVSRLPDFLHDLGWDMTEWNFAGRNVSGRMRKGTKGLTFCDSTSLLPTSLAAIGGMVGRRKLVMPADDAPEEAWLEYCQRDVLVLAEAVLTLMDWWDEHKLGHWAMTGAGCGWNAMRHMTPKKSFLVKTEPEGIAHDRLAIRGGRRDVTRVGEIAGGPFALLDFSNAHLTIAATQLLPKARLTFHDGFPLDSIHIAGNRFGVVADCEVETPSPLYPLRTPDGVFYPVGRFRAPLASPEIVAARDRGHLRAVGAGYVHDLGFPLAGWARWALNLMGVADPEQPPVVGAMVKQWGRSVVGKFAARGSRTVDRGPAQWPTWHLERGTSGPNHAPAADVHIAGRHWWVIRDLDGDNAYPAVLAFVESYVRVALNRMLDALGEDVWVCCDTDGVVVDLARAREWLCEGSRGRSVPRRPDRVAEALCEALGALTRPLVPKVKMLSETLHVAGPQHYSGDTFERAAGRPGKPELDSDGALRHWRWPKVAWQMEHGSPDGFTRVEAEWTAPATTAHRWVLTDGWTLPVMAHLNGDGQSHLTSWETMSPILGGGRLAPVQAPAVRPRVR